MGLFDLLGFEEDEYKAKLKYTSDEELLLNERRKRRQFVSSGASSKSAFETRPWFVD
jgi:hypothetical protein